MSLQEGTYVSWTGQRPAVGVISRRSDFYKDEAYELKAVFIIKEDRFANHFERYTSCDARHLKEITCEEYTKTVTANGRDREN